MRIDNMMKQSISRAAMILLLCVLMTMTAWAQTTENLGGYDFPSEQIRKAATT